MFLRAFRRVKSTIWTPVWEQQAPTRAAETTQEPSDDGGPEEETATGIVTSIDGEPEEETVTGIVTLIDGAYGMINSKMHFYYPVPGMTVKMGDEVRFVRTRSSPTEMWQVKEIIEVVGHTWVEKEEDEEEEVVEEGRRELQGKVEAAGDKYARIILGEFRGSLDLTEFGLPRVAPGDWLLLDLTCNFVPGTSQIKNILQVHGAHASQVKKCKGRVTSVNKDFGLVDNKFVFHQAVCKAYIPRIRDMVEVVAIESTQGNHAWRVINIKQVENIVDPSPGLKSEPEKCVPTIEGVEASNEASATAGDAQSSEEKKDQVPPTADQVILADSDENRGIQILPYLVNFETIQVGRAGAREIEITNTIDSHVVLYNITFLSGKDFKVYDTDLVSHLMVPAHRAVTVKLICDPSNFGTPCDIAVFTFSNFTMLRRVTATAVASSAVTALRCAANKMNKVRDSKIVKGEFSVQTSYLIPRRLPQYPVPEMLYDIYVTYDWRDDRRFMEMFPALGKRLTPATYVDKLDGLLYLEEAENMLHLREYDVIGATFRRKGEFLAMAVTGLSEARPSIMVGDCVIASPPYDKAADRFQGCIHEVHSTEIYLRFAPSFHNQYDAETYDVSFEVSRSGYRRLHQGIELFLQNLPVEILFPTQVMVRQPRVSFNEVGNEAPCPPTQLPKDGAGKLTIRPAEGMEVCKTTKKMVSEANAPRKPTQYGAVDVRYKDSTTTDGASSGDNSSLQSRKSQSVTAPDIGPSLARRKPNLHIRDYSDLMRALKSNWRVGLTHPVPLRWVNRNLNEQQKNAVRRILKGEARPLPYIIYGPPGTGKTVTLIEAALQAYRLINFSRILVVTPSNSSADLIVVRLHRSGVIKFSDMVRLNSFRRGTDTLTDEVRPYCMDSDHLDQVVRHRLVVTTCNAAGTIYTLGLPNGHFTHVFIDEAGYANEPEALVPIGLLSTSDGEAQVVLAGDPKQLGPVLTSRLAKRNGLERSFLERLTENPLYRRDDVKFAHDGNYDPLLVTKLVINYRSDPLLLKLPSRMFYHDELVAQADLRQWSHLRELDIFPTKKVAMVFCGMKGENEQDKDSPSWYNREEVLQVWKHLHVLYEQGGLKPEQVGIITPYRKQVEKIRHFLEDRNVPKPKIGSVEEFQGQERVAIILSTVRSVHDLRKMNQIFNLGFVASPKRMNVALTRAEACLVVIGNPHVLALDMEWRAFLSYVYELGAYKGCEMPAMVISGDDDEDGRPYIY